LAVFTRDLIFGMEAMVQDAVITIGAHIAGEGDITTMEGAEETGTHDI